MNVTLFSNFQAVYFLIFLLHLTWESFIRLILWNAVVDGGGVSLHILSLCTETFNDIRVFEYYTKYKCPLMKQLKSSPRLRCMHENKQLRQTRQRQNQGIIPSSLALWNTLLSVLGLLAGEWPPQLQYYTACWQLRKVVPLKFPQLAGSFTKNLLLSRLPPPRPAPPAVIVHCFYNLGDRDSCKFHDLPECLNPLCFSASFKEKSYVTHCYLTYLPRAEYIHHWLYIVVFRMA